MSMRRSAQLLDAPGGCGEHMGQRCVAALL